MGVDVQGNRLEYEVKGWGRDEENWGIAYGIIPGRTDEEGVWKELDALLDRRWRRADGQEMRILVTFVDSGYISDMVYRQCAMRTPKRVFAIKGETGQGKEYVHMSSEMKKKKGVYLFMIGVDVGKEAIQYSLNLKTSGARYSHFPSDPKAGYTKKYFEGLFSEKMEVRSRYGRQTLVWVEDKSVHARNEPLDLFNYNRAAYMGFHFDLNAIEERLMGKKRIVRQNDMERKRKRRVLDAGIDV